MRYTIKFILVLVIAFAASAFTYSTSNDWKLYKEFQGVQVYTKVSSCKLEYTKKSANYLIFKYVNTTSKKLRISGRVDAYYNGICRSCGLDSPNEYEFSIDLKPNSTEKGNCSDELKAFKLYYGQVDKDVADLNKFEFSNVTVTSF